MSGTLFIVATPIGNLDDLTIRIRKVIEQSKFVLAEDTRVTIKILNHLNLKKQMVSCHEHNEGARLQELAQAAAQGDSVALISDAGTPLISDPGYQIVREAIALGMSVVPIPGPSAFLLALVGSGLPCDKFVFEGFLPDKVSAQKSRLEELRTDNRTIVFYVSPHKLIKNLTALLDVFGDRDICLARELTKLHEEFVRGKISTIIEKYSNQEIRGEFVLVVAGMTANSQSETTEDELRDAIRKELKANRSVKDIAALLADQFHCKKSDVYRLALDEQNAGEQLSDT
ncbi:MAG: 16S rRNA (cytidine(1402)-2'-O)-methyltransferase [Cyanobacteria bacterium SZAS LIN-5]|nr:16S rRNA (cytidine(1402)-2'-O)-methyltransferase [Cyanobacteria bacterium SZAS LIN-5]RTL45257.1 MAG: 16S rRNA (cytidine(1402)-2'-O)-methyltransferase [Candidatus Melainabacteria bacterium]